MAENQCEKAHCNKCYRKRPPLKPSFVFWTESPYNQAIMRMIGYFLLPLLGVVLGIYLATHLNFAVTEELSVFIAVGLIITLDLLVEGTSQFLGNRFSLRSMLLTYFFNLLFAYFLLTIGNLMRVDLYIALFIVFGIKLFSNLAYISQKFFSKLQF